VRATVAPYRFFFCGAGSFKGALRRLVGVGSLVGANDVAGGGAGVICEGATRQEQNTSHVLECVWGRVFQFASRHTYIYTYILSNYSVLHPSRRCLLWMSRKLKREVKEGGTEGETLMLRCSGLDG